MNDVDDYLYDVLRDRYRIDLQPQEMDDMIAKSLQLAKHRHQLMRGASV
jgi:type I restriction enzyme, R subunit